MSFRRSLLLLILASTLITFVLLVIGSGAGYGEYHGGYAVIEADASVDDRILRERLDAGANNFAGSPVSESSQWVMLDNFGSMEVISLDKYSERLFSFDPRNDGYAGKLSNIFVRDGKRFVYIPLRAGNWVPAFMDRQFSELLGDIPFSAGYIGIGRPSSLFFIVYAAASIALLVICYVKKNRHHGAAGIIVLLPLLSCLAFFGASGLAAAALLMGLSSMLREPLNELVMLLKSGKNTQKLKLIFKDVIEPYRLYWFFLFFFAAAIGIVVVFSQLKLSFVLLVSAAVCAVFFLSVKTISLWRGSHRRFIPVLIIKRRFPDFAFSLYMTPLTAAAFLAMLLTPYMSGAYVSEGKFDHIIEEQDYYEHLAFQASFSMQKIGRPGTTYPGFKLDADGLPSPDTAVTGVPVFKAEDYPPFPLKHLMDFFNSVNTGSRPSVNTGKGRGITDYISLILLFFILPGLLLKGKMTAPSKIQFAGLKRVSGKLHRTDKNRIKMLLYKSKNTLSTKRSPSLFLLDGGSRKDA